jgi:lantibiotic modifying enzyme
VDATLHGAGAGITYFLTKLACTTDDDRVGAAARQAARFVASSPHDGRFGFYTGYAGLVLAVQHAATSLDDADLERLADAAQPTAGGIEWPAWPDGRGPWQELFHGTAGIALVAAEIGRLDLAGAAGRRLVGLGLSADAGRWWRSRPDDHQPAPNIAHGTAGIAYALATLGERTGDGRDPYSLGCCSGPPGLGCLFLRLASLTGDDAWTEWALRCARAVRSSGLPTRLYPGFWDNVGQRWHNIEHTAADPVLPAQTGWMQGAAGIGASLLRAYRVLTDGTAGPWLPSWPFPAECTALG